MAGLMKEAMAERVIEDAGIGSEDRGLTKYTKKGRLKGSRVKKVRRGRVEK